MHLIDPTARLWRRSHLSAGLALWFAWSLNQRFRKSSVTENWWDASEFVTSGTYLAKASASSPVCHYWWWCSRDHPSKTALLSSLTEQSTSSPWG